MLLALADRHIAFDIVGNENGPVGTPPAGNILIADSIPGALRHVFKGARHVPMVEQAEAFSAVMLEWLEAQREHPAERLAVSA